MRDPGGPALLRRAEPCMGTVFSFTVALPQSAARPAAEAALDAAVALLDELDAAWSPRRSASFTGRVRAGEVLDPRREDPQGRLGVDAVLRRCVAAGRFTRDAYDAWAEPGGFDPSGLVKGWAVDRAASLLQRAGFADVAVDGGGDVAVRGSAPGGDGWRVGVRDPRDSRRLLGRVRLVGGAGLAASLRPGAGRYVGVWVAGPDLGWADAFATAAAQAQDPEPSWLAASPVYRALGMTPEGALHGGLADELEPAADRPAPARPLLLAAGRPGTATAVDAGVT